MKHNFRLRSFNRLSLLIVSGIILLTCAANAQILDYRSFNSRLNVSWVKLHGSKLAPAISVNSLTLIDADTHLPISQFNPIANGSTINLAKLPSHNLTIQANTSPATVGSVAFDLVNSGYLNIANSSPYDLCGSAPCSNLDVGLHSLTTTPYTGANASGSAGTSMNISFSVVDPTPTPTPKASSTPTSAPTPTVNPTSTGGLTPPTIANPQNPVSFGADSTGKNDSTKAFQEALNAGSVSVPPGTFLITGQLQMTKGQSLQCQPGVYLKSTTSQSTAFEMILIESSNASVYGCNFIGPNANITSQPPVEGTIIQVFVEIASNSNNIVIANDDFNGIGGAVGAITTEGGVGSSASTATPENLTIQNNTFEHCGYYGVQLASINGATVTHNTLNDCSGFVESNIGQINTGVVASDNTFTFTYGIGDDSAHGSSGFDGLTCGVSASGAAFNYSGNLCENNVVNGTHASTILMNAVGGGQNDATYTNNTCNSPCVLNSFN